MPALPNANRTISPNSKATTLLLDDYSQEALLMHLLQRSKKAAQDIFFAREKDYVGLFVEINAFEQAQISLFPVQCTSFATKAEFLTQLLGWQVDSEALKNRYYLEKNKNTYSKDIDRRANQLKKIISV